MRGHENQGALPDALQHGGEDRVESLEHSTGEVAVEPFGVGLELGELGHPVRASHVVRATLCPGGRALSTRCGPATGGGTAAGAVVGARAKSDSNN